MAKKVNNALSGADLHRAGFYEKYIKRVLDVLCGVAAVLVFWWLYVIVAVLVRVKLGAPVLFIQERPGKDEKIFKLYKFRTMTDEKDENGNLLPDDRRLTKFGKWLRSTSLDEIPEAFNLINGTLSVVGPRPLLVSYLERYTPEQHRRHLVRPGLSGWAQINGRNAATWEEKFERDVWYVDNISFLLDVKVVFMTVIKAFVKKEGVSSNTSATMEEFTGTKEKV